MPSHPWILICPSTRGLGHHLTRALLSTTSLPILATTRTHDLASAKAALLSGPDPPDARQASRLHLATVDVTDEASIQRAALLARGLFPPQTHHLHFCAAIPGVLHPERHTSAVDPGLSLETFAVNAVGPLLLAKHFVDFLPRRGTDLGDRPCSRGAGRQGPGVGRDGDAGRVLPPHATWLFMSARVGSTADNKLGGWFSYRASKAAVNSLAKTLDLMLRARGGDKALAVAYHPGTVRTDFSRHYWGGVPEGRLFEPAFAVERMLAVVRGLGVRHRGRCLDWRGEVVPP